MQIQPGQLIKDLFSDSEIKHPNRGGCLSEEWPGSGTLLWQSAVTTTEHFEVRDGPEVLKGTSLPSKCWQTQFEFDFLPQRLPALW